MKLGPQLVVLLLLVSSCDDKKENKHIYFIFDDGPGAIGKTTVEPPDGKTVTANHLSGLPRDILVDYNTNKLYVSMGHSAEIYEFTNENIGHINRIYKLQTHVVTAMALDPTRNRIYWAEGSFHKIYMGSLDGNKTPVLLFDGEKVTSFCTGMALNVETNTLYFTDFNEDKIFEADLNLGTMPTEFLDNAKFEINGPLDLSLSKDGSSLYWSDLDDRIIRTDVMNKASELVYNYPAKAISLDHLSDDLYFSDGNQIFKISLNGTLNFTKVLDAQGIIGFVVF